MKQYLFRFVNGLYKWLPIIMGCHCKASRSFFYKGLQFPVCARCTGQIVGGLILLLSFWFYHPKALWLAVMLLPLIIDGVIQQVMAYESTNPRRFITGILFGYGLLALIFLSVHAVFQFGFELGTQWRANLT